MRGIGGVLERVRNGELGYFSFSPLGSHLLGSIPFWWFQFSADWHTPVPGPLVKASP